MNAARTSGGPRCRVLAIIGSGETSPTMVEIHKTLVAMLDDPSPTAVVLDTPYAFQENVAEVSAKARRYFATSVGLKVHVVSTVDGGDAEIDAVRSADWLFIGPGSPSYAMRRWRANGVDAALRERVAAGDGVTVLASAAAATVGAATVPVYEVYKAGADPHWLPGLDLLDVFDLKVAVIPHFNNTEGGTHDTRFCYLGERRLAAMERDLPAAAVLGVDEHTAVLIDLRARQVTVAGRGVLTVRRRGATRTLPAGSVLTIDELRDLVTGVAPLSGEAAPPTLPPNGDGRPAAVRDVAAAGGTGTPAPLPDVTRECERRFEEALAGRDGPGMVAAILDLEDTIHAWASDTEEDQGVDQARTVLRGLITRLGVAVADTRADPADLLRPAAEPLLKLRESLRRQHRYAEADTIRAALGRVGLAINDTPSGTRWRAADR